MNHFTRLNPSYLRLSKPLPDRPARPYNLRRICGHSIRIRQVYSTEVNSQASRRVQLCLGGLVPNPGSGNKPGVVAELTLLGFNDGETH